MFRLLTLTCHIIATLLLLTFWLTPTSLLVKRYALLLIIHGVCCVKYRLAHGTNEAAYARNVNICAGRLLLLEGARPSGRGPRVSERGTERGATESRDYVPTEGEEAQKNPREVARLLPPKSGERGPR